MFEIPVESVYVSVAPPLVTETIILPLSTLSFDKTNLGFAS